MRKSNLKLADTERPARLTYEEAGQAAKALALSSGGDNDDMALLLLLCQTLAGEEDSNERFELLTAIEAQVGVYLPGFDKLLEVETGRVRELLRKGRAR